MMSKHNAIVLPTHLPEPFFQGEISTLLYKGSPFLDMFHLPIIYTLTIPICALCRKKMWRRDSEIFHLFHSSHQRILLCLLMPNLPHACLFFLQLSLMFSVSLLSHLLNCCILNIILRSIMTLWSKIPQFLHS